MADDLSRRQEEFERRFPALVEVWRSICVAFNFAKGLLQRVWLSQTGDNRERVMLEEHPRYVAAQEYRSQFTPQEGCNYEWVCELAKEEYKQVEEAGRYLDEKADAIVKYLGSGTTIVSLGSLFTITKVSAFFPYFLLPSVIFALRAINQAVRARRPMPHPTPPVGEAIKYAKAYGDAAEATFIGLWYQCTDGLHVVNERKANLVNRASRNYYRAVLLLLFPLLAWPIYVEFVLPAAPAKVEAAKSAPESAPSHKLPSEDPR